MIETTLIFLFDSKDNILLSMKKRGFWVGKRNGAGGKLHPGETILQAALRELEEEVGVQLSPKELKYKGRLHFSRENIPNNDNICSVFFANYEG
jgi:8-oxo-dGTP pyrophosphatase MutT (NUDIX family)